MKKKINAFDYANHICSALPKGILLTTCVDGMPNTMTIGWGSIGIQWGKPIFIVYVRQSRYTKDLLDRAGEFTVNVPMGDGCKNILSVCGTKSGRDVDKFRELGLTPEEPNVISTPGIKELPLTLECRVIYKQDQPYELMPEDVLPRYYPKNEAGEADIHTIYYGQIMDAYIIE